MQQCLLQAGYPAHEPLVHIFFNGASMAQSMDVLKMQANDSQLVVYVYYHGTPDTRFDRDYYVTHHLPLCMDAWQQYGLQSMAAFFLALEQSGTIAICESVFRDEAAMNAAWGSPEAARVMADVARYTDATPVRVRAVAL